MTCKVVYAESFRDELDATLSYYVTELGLINSADKLATAIESSLAVIAENPDAKALSIKPALRDHGLREWYVKSYVLVYRVDGDCVYLEHLFHQSQDFQNLL